MGAESGATGLTAYPETEAALRGDLRRARVDARSLSRPLSRCALGACRGTCCYDGVYLEPDGAAVVQGLAAAERPFFAALGLDLPAVAVVEGDWDGQPGGLKTAVVPRPFSRLVPRYPPHFADTACAFLLGDGRCALQLLSVARGHHPWYYKPIPCWMHPLTLEAPPAPSGTPSGAEAGRPALLLPDGTSDPYRRPGYDGFSSRTPCGMATPAAPPAHRVLRPELVFLSRLAGRDLLRPAAGAAPGVPPDA